MQEHRIAETLTIDVKPGWKKGTKITFPEKGDDAPGYIAADIIFVVDEKRHPQFEVEPHLSSILPQTSAK